MFLDGNQSLGTLVGFRSMLVLMDHGGRRRMILPNGKPIWARTTGHVDVHIQPHTSSGIHVYEIDALLGRLTDDGSLQSRFMLSYLHALTSYCAPNALTEYRD
jgi:hypothetical protein